ncbi:MAG: hypothetical protein I3274_06260 [Candidatus Moeniiplasma glomeromycotorum]|nr:hypothetical protein [Candidatus Moeniiplasma glomeromycotorum]
MVNNNLELKIRLIQGETRESKREKEKCLEALGGLIACFISLIIGSIYFFVIKKEYETWHIFFTGLIGVGILILGYYWWNRYQKASKRLEELKKELYLLKKALKKEEG